MNSVLLTGTRAPATLDLARRLHREGVRVIGADSVRFPLGRFSRAFAAHHRVPPPRQRPADFVEAVLRLLDRERIEWLWPTCEEIFYLATAHDRLSAAARVFFEPLAKLDPLHDKLAFARWAGPLAPGSWPAAEAPADRRLVWKARYSRFGCRVRFDGPPPSPEGWMAQDCIEGTEFSTWALCLAGEVRILTNYQCPVRAGGGAGCAFEPDWDADASDAVAVFAEKLRFTGSLAFDWIRSGEGSLRVLECNPRLTSGLHLLAPEVRIADLFARGVPGRPPMRAAQLLWPTFCNSLRIAGTTPDLVFARDDPLPALGQIPAFAEVAAISLRRGIPLTAATTHDIEYNGP